MTKELLNNLNNITQNAKFSFNDRGMSVYIQNFEKIFDNKTKLYMSDTDLKNNNDIDREEYLSEEDEEEKLIKKQKNVSSLKASENEKILNIISETIDEAEAEAVVDTTISGVCENSEENVEDENTEEKANADSTSDTKDTTITNEESTMYTNADPLENPTAALLLHSQITATKLNVVKETDKDCEEPDRINLKDYSQNTEKNRNDYTQKDLKLVNLVQRESTTDSQKNSESVSINTKVIKDLNIESITSGNSNSKSSFGNLMQNETPQEQAVKIMIQSAGEIESEPQICATTEVQSANMLARAQSVITKTTSVNISSEKIIEQITKQLETMYNNSKVNITMNPASLGKIHLQIINSKDGGLTAQFTVMTREAHDLITKGLDGLKENLLVQGVNIDNIHVKLEEIAEQEYSQDYTEKENSNGGNKQQGTKKQKQEEKPFEQTMYDIENNDKV